ncbi:MAG: hypothetical protein ACI9JM_000410 [Halioglobus sp.]|jgi:hypothetical protein
MLACRPIGSSTLTLLGQTPVADVLFDTGNNSNTLHSANGTGWYYDESGTDLRGFVGDGDSVNRGNCDTDFSGANEERLCWHLNPSNGGYRCGATENLNSSTAWEYVVYTSSDQPANIPVPVLPGLIFSSLATRQLLKR